MKKKYRILHLEDVAVDAEIVKRELKKNHIDFDYLLVDSEKGYINALDNFRPDIVLCDHALPAFSSLEALSILKEKNLNIPFIVITGLTTEDAAMARITEGADDYVLKDRLKRLPHAIINAFEKYRLERDKKNLLTDAKITEASSEKLLAQLSGKLLLTSKISGIGIWEYIFKEKKFLADEVLLAQYGITPAEFMGTMASWMQYIHPDDKDRIGEMFQNALAQPADFTTEFRVVWPDGSIHYINGIAIVQYDNDGNPLRFIGTNQDITERKNAEEKIKESELRYRLLIEQATDAICITNASLKFIDINQYGCEVFGYTLAEALQLSLPDILFAEDMEGNPLKMNELKLGETVRNERRLKRKDGTPVDMEVSTKLMEDGRMIMFGHDITERKKAQKKIIESEAKFRAFFDNSMDGILLTITDGAILSANPAACEVFQMTEKEICTAGTGGIIDLKDPRAEALIKERKRTGKAKGELTYLRKDGSNFPGEISSVLFKDSYGQEKTSMIIRDITERKRGEESLLLTQFAIDNAADAVFWMTPDARIINFNEAACVMLGYTRPQMLDLSISEIDPNYNKEIWPIHFAELRQKGSLIFETIQQAKDGRLIPVEVRANYIKFGDRELNCAFVRNISERKKAEESLRQSEAFNHGVLNSLSSHIAVIDILGNIVAVNDSWTRFGIENGQTTLQRTGPGSNYYKVCEKSAKAGEEISTVALRGIKDVMEDKITSFYFEYPCHSPETRRWFGMRALKFESDVPTVVVAHMDITERKLAEEKLIITSNSLQHALNDLNKIMDSSLDVICAVDAGGNFIKVSAASESVWGYKPEELIGTPLINLVHHEDNEETYKTAGHVMAGNNVAHFENRYIHKDGSLVPIEWSARWDEKDQMRYGIARDVTVKKRLEKAIKGEERRLKDLFSQAPTSMGVLKGANHVFEKANPPYLKLIGKNDIIGKTLAEVLPEVAGQGFIELLDKVYETGQSFSANEMLVKLKRNGIDIDLYVNLLYQAYKNDEGKIEGIFFFAVDVTEQVVSRKKIEESENRFRAIIEKSTDMKTLSTIDGEFIYVSPSITKLFGYSLEEILNTFAFDIIHPDDLAEFAVKRKTILQIPGKSFHIRQRFLHKNGNWIWCEGTVTNMLDEPGINALVSNFRDISEKITNEAQKEFDSNNLNALINNTNDLMWSVDRDFKLITSNQPFDDMGKVNFGKSIIKGSNVLSAANSPEVTSHFKQLYERAFAGEAFTETEHFDFPVELWTEISYYPIRKGDEVIGAACHSRDITSIKKAEQEMQQLTNRLVLATNSAKMGIWDWDLEKNHLKWDEGMHKLYQTDDLQFESVYEGWLSRLHPEDKQRVNENIQLAISGEKNYDTEFKIIWSDLSVHHIKASALIERDHTGKAIRMIGANLDITGRKKAEEENKFKAELLNTIGQATIATDLHGKINFWNKAAEEIYGWAEEEALGKNIIEITPSQQSKEEGEEIMKELSIGRSWSGEFLVKGKNGKNFPAFVTTSPIYNPQHQLAGIIGISTDISERKKIEAQIKDSEQRYRSLFEQNLAGFYQSNAAGKLINCNKAFSNMLKYDSPEELLKVNAHELYFSSEDRASFINNVLEKKKLFNYEGVLKCKDGSALYFLENISEQKDPVTGEEFFDGILIDVTEKKLAELQLNESNERFKNVSKATSDAIWDWNLVDKTIYWGEGFKTIFGYSPEELKNNISSSHDRIHPEDLDRVVKKIYECIDGTEINWADEYRYLKTDQTYANVIDRGFIIRDQEGKGIRMVGAMQDVTERQVLEGLLDKATSLARIGGWELNLVENTLLWSGFTSHLHEVEADFIPDLATGINFYKEGRSRDLITLKVQEGINSGTPWDEEFEIITAKGNERWVRCIGNAEIIDGKCVKLFGSFQDINERKIIELSALAVLNEKNTILESIGDAFFAVDKNWKVTYWNNQAEKMLIRPKNEIVGHNFWEVFPDWIGSESYIRFHQAVETKKVIHFEVDYAPLAKWYEAIAYPSDNGLSIYFKDVTERKLSEINLNELNESLKIQAKDLAVSNAELEQFAYVASHDLQEPLRMVTSFLTQLEKKYGNVIDDKGKKYIEFAVDGAKRMRQIILDLLEFSRVGRIEDKLEIVDLNIIVEEIQMLFRKQIEEKSAVVRVGKLPVINSYNAPVKQVFQNLISNALKYTHKELPAKIDITVEESDSHWQFAVSDNGIGIAKEYFNKIFVIFQRLHNKDEFSGTGMGLAVTKKIIENLGGKIWIESEEGKGSIFYFTLLKK